jgi:ribosomal protein S18 acetylase RimI-like enzyme
MRGGVPHPACYALRRAKPADQAAIYRICRSTGDAGADVPPGRDGQLLGHLFAGPYLALSADFARVVEDELGIGGYLVASPDSSRFYADMERLWLPGLRRQYADFVAQDPADERLHALLFSHWSLDPRLADWPAHLHLNLDARMQGRGIGSELMVAGLAALRAAGAPGVHLGVDPRNKRALAWYPQFGFGEHLHEPGCVWLVRSLSPPPDVLNRR